MTDPSQTVTLNGDAQDLTWNVYYSNLLISNDSNAVVYVRSDGIAAVAAADGTQAVTAGEDLLVSNQLPLPDADVPGRDESESVGWEVQQAYQGSDLTTVSVIGAGTGDVTVCAS